MFVFIKAINGKGIVHLNTSLCEWWIAAGFLTKKRQAFTVEYHDEPGAPQACGPSPLLFTLLIHDGTPNYSTNLYIKFADDTPVVDLINNLDQKIYRNNANCQAMLFRKNNLLLNVSKTKEIVSDFGRTHTQHLLLNNRKTLQYIVNVAGKLTSASLPSFLDMYPSSLQSN